jgi:hypothetical protein
MTDTPRLENGSAPTDEGDDFVRVRFAGGRFDSHTIPFDVLPDLSAYRDLIVEIAKYLFRVRNPDRQRVPKGFVESFQLGLSQVIQGNSATALARRIESSDEYAQAELAFPHREFEDARDLIDRVIAAANDEQELPSDFPKELVGRFNRFGQSLRTGEFAEISYSNSAAARYDGKTRKRIVLSANSTYENPLDQKFTLDGGALSSNLVHVLDTEGNRFDFRVDSNEECERAIANRRHQVRLVGVGQFDRHDRLSKIITCNELIYTDDEPRQSFEDRLDEIAQTPSGWYSEGNPAPNSNAIAKMRNFVKLVTDEASVPVPYIYPLPNGGITAEWTIGDWQVSANVDVSNFAIELHALNVDTDQELESAITAEDEQAIAIFGRFWNEMNALQGTEDADFS